MHNFADRHRRIISRPEAAELLGFPVKTIDKMLRAGELETVVLAGKPRITRRSVMALKERLEPLVVTAD